MRNNFKPHSDVSIARAKKLPRKLFAPSYDDQTPELQQPSRSMTEVGKSRSTMVHVGPCRGDTDSILN